MDIKEYWNKWKTQVKTMMIRHWTLCSEQQPTPVEAHGSPLLVWRQNCTPFLGDMRAAPVSTEPALEQILNWVVAHTQCQTSIPSNNLYPAVSNSESLFETEAHLPPWQNRLKTSASIHVSLKPEYKQTSLTCCWLSQYELTLCSHTLLKLTENVPK